jgi:hypothetical protein
MQPPAVMTATASGGPLATPFAATRQRARWCSVRAGLIRTLSAPARRFCFFAPERRALPTHLTPLYGAALLSMVPLPSCWR